MSVYTLLVLLAPQVFPPKTVVSDQNLGLLYHVIFSLFFFEGEGECCAKRRRKGTKSIITGVGSKQGQDRMCLTPGRPSSSSSCFSCSRMLLTSVFYFLCDSTKFVFFSRPWEDLSEWNLCRRVCYKIRMTSVFGRVIYRAIGSKSILAKVVMTFSKNNTRLMEFMEFDNKHTLLS